MLNELPQRVTLRVVWLLAGVLLLGGCAQPSEQVDAPPPSPAITRTAGPRQALATSTAAGEATAAPGPRPSPTARGQIRAAEEHTSQRIPLTDMGTQLYYGFEGGLYPGGVNEMPPEHADEGVARGRAIQPLGLDGEPDPSGKVVLLSIGMSNTSMEFCRALGPNSPHDGVSCAEQSFMGYAGADRAVDSESLVIVNGARGGQVADRWDAPDEANYDHIRDSLLEPLALSESQVQVIWLKVTDVTPDNPPSLPDEEANAYALAGRLANIVRALKARYPNLQQVFLSSRIYAGYTTRELNPEPYAYETGFAVKWLIEAQIRQMASNARRIDSLAGDLNYETVAPWLAWGPYLWADGASPRSDGLVWKPEDFGNDDTHPSISGRAKVGRLLLDFFKSSPFTTCWFLAGAGPEACGGAGDEVVAEAATSTPRAQTEQADNGAGQQVDSEGVGPLNEEARPLTELGNSTYLGFSGGLYPDVANEPPQAHAAEGLARIQAIQPLDQQGNPDPAGKIVLLSIGMSNTMMEFCGEWVLATDCEPYSLIGQARSDPSVDKSNLAIVNGARGAQTASRWDAAGDQNYDRIRDGFLAPLDLSEEQVQVVWLKVTDFIQGQPSLPDENAQAYTLAATMGDIVRTLKARYPNLQMVFLSSRTYAGYAQRDLSPEPYAYETGFAVKWLIEAQIRQMASGSASPLVGDLNYDSAAPWLAWGPYLWADGDTPRQEDGLVWLPEDFGAEDGTHPSVLGREKVARLLLDFFKTSPFTGCWFLADGVCQ